MPNRIVFVSAVTLALAAAAAPSAARAHCDGVDGPVVRAAQRALDAGKPDAALAWVKPEGEREIRDAFARTVAVRKLGGEARTLADRWFFETLVRVHRAGEGAPFDGLKPAGRDLGPAIPAADRAVESGKPDEVEALLVAAVRKGVRERLAEVRALRGDASKSVAAGRAYVAAYVPFLHYVEGVHEIAANGPAHGEEAAAAAEAEIHAAPAAEHAHR